MDITALFNLFLIVGAVQGFVFILATFSLRRKIELPVLFLNLFVLFLSLNNLQSWVIDRQNYGEDELSRLSTFPWYILIVPMFYSFLIHYLQIEKKKTPLMYLSATLFLVALAARFFLIHAVDDQQIDISVLKQYNLMEDVFAFLYSVLLYVMSINLLKRQKALFPDILIYDNLKWVKLFLRLGGVVFGFWVLAIALNMFSTKYKAPYSYYPLRFFSSILIYWVAYQGFFQYRLLKDRIKLRAIIRERKANVTDDVRAKEHDLNVSSKFTFDKFEDYVMSNKSHLNPSLSLDQLAGELGIGATTLSRVVNAGNVNFSDYINSLRVAEATKILINPDFDDYTIVAIGLECGFNSKSTFYAAFKKAMDQTPSEYKKQLLA